MRFSVSVESLVRGLFPFLLVGLVGCGDGDSQPGSPAGDWLVVSFENVTQGIRVDCPGMSGSVECGTATLTLNESGELIIVETTDETGTPDPYRFEGTWRTEGDQLTIELRAEGDDADSLAPNDPPDVVTGTYTVSGDTLTFGGEDDAGDTIVTTYERL